jgi:ribosomal protein S18 acetylase RimI-like enzyme
MPTYRDGLGDCTERYVKSDHGWLEYRYGPGHTVELVNFEVEKEFRDRGEGSAMLQRLIAESKAANFRTIFGFFQEHNTGMYRFYSRHGFTILLVPNYYSIGHHAYLVTLNIR